MLRRVTVTLALFLFGLPATAQSPEEIVRWIYASLSGPGPALQQGLDYLSSPDQRSNYFSRRMVMFFDANDSYGDDLAQACVDFGFAIPGNDFDAAEVARSLELSTQPGPEGMTIVARFTNFGSPAQVTYDFAQEDGFWKIDDVAGEGFRVSQIPCTPKAAAPVTAFCYRQGEDGLRLDLAAGGGGARVEFWSWQANGHSCSGEMVGQAVAGGWDFPATGGCLLQLRAASDGSLQLADPDWACKRSLCGQRAVLDGLSFPRSSQIDCAGWQRASN
ncbi:hypothetical protein [Roseobacter sinensis]|uniref:DUF3828 domain-containing protein n=1 Tax=Roseobacter sinensis TaxID=2931391 RepID=A0ABT3BA74_9RHOB|nr:hypothetical protein [Roseobacter sp. WL0113]MCV3270469.1 hypothetical protein [Roseobacter sp. WL0113]